MAANEGHAVDRAGASQHLSLRQVEGTRAVVRGAMGGEAPVVGRVDEQPAHAGRHADPDGVWRSSCLQEQHFDILILTQPGRENASREAASRDDVVELNSAHARVAPLKPGI